MAPTLVAQPFHHPGWVYEEQYDGWRVLAYKDDQSVRLMSRTGSDLSTRFPYLVRAVRTLPSRTLILDGEVCIFDERLVSRAELLGDPLSDEVAPLALFKVFDCLYARQRDLRHLPLESRRRWLEAEVQGERILPARRLPDDGFEAWQEVLARGYQGLVAKDPQSSYVGGRSIKWLKVKASGRREGERGWGPILKT
jgi:bifunctional non-homologous end joining protein LigD